MCRLFSLYHQWPAFIPCSLYLNPLSPKAISIPIQFPGALISLLVWFIETIRRPCVHGRMKDIYEEKRKSSLRVHPMDTVRMKAREVLGTGV